MIFILVFQEQYVGTCDYCCSQQQLLHKTQKEMVPMPSRVMTMSLVTFFFISERRK
jgi:hypothetical protein